MFGEIGRDIAEKMLGPAPFKIGDLVRHPFGHLVEITDGEYWGRMGLSNFWYWRDVLPDGTLSNEERSGYGWCVSSAKRAQTAHSQDAEDRCRRYLARANEANERGDKTKAGHFCDRAQYWLDRYYKLSGNRF